MKTSDKPQISKKWWTSEKPAEIKGVELEKALQAAEKALADEKKKSDPSSIEVCMAMLRDLCSAADKTIKKELDKKRHKDEITVLEKYDGLVKVEVKRLEEAKVKLSSSQNGDGENEDDEESEDKIFQPEYCYKMLKLLRSTGKELNFGFGLNTKDPAASKLLLTRKGKPDRLFKALKKDGNFSNRLITYGKAVPEAQDGKTLVFKLAESAGEPPQIQKLGRQYLRGDKNLKFRKLKLILPGGQTFEDTEPDTEDEEARVAGVGGETLSPQQKEEIRKELDRMGLEMDQLMAELQTA